MYTFEHNLRSGDKVIISGTIKVHAQFINKFDVSNVSEFVDGIMGLPQEDLRMIFVLTDRIFGLHLMGHQDIYIKCYLPNRTTMTIPERRDALIKIGKIRQMSFLDQYLAEIRELLNEYSMTYNMEQLLIRQMEASRESYVNINNDYTILLDALARFYEDHEKDSSDESQEKIGSVEIGSIMFQEEYNMAIKEYLERMK